MGLGWDFIGDYTQYQDQSQISVALKGEEDSVSNPSNSTLAIWQFVHEMKPGDVIYAKKGVNLIVGRGIVESDYYFDSERNVLKNLRKVKWTNKGEWVNPRKLIRKTLTEITSSLDYIKELESLFLSNKNCNVYDKEMFLNDVFMDENDYDILTALMLRKKNVILQGPPGVGKTYTAEKLAYSIMGTVDPSRVIVVQFHQSYSYEDFVEGFRPIETGGFKLEHGPFYEFCKLAEKNPNNDPFFFIIDEINRGNISKIFGELFTLIEADKRGKKLKLLYGKEPFLIPNNLFLIGMMNTADRSLAMIDYALRRRFAFFSMEPGFDTKGFKEYSQSLEYNKFNALIDCIKELNSEIACDESLGKGFCIGHSYFCDFDPEEINKSLLLNVINYEITPLLVEYWFDEPQKVNFWSEKLINSVKLSLHV